MPPGVNDRAIIANGHTIDITGFTDWANLTLEGTGKFRTTSGSLTVRGAVVFDGGCDVASAYGRLGPSTTFKYGSVGPAGGAACRWLESNGALGARAVHEAYGTYGTSIGGIVATYTDFRKAGDDTHSGFVVPYELSSGMHHIRWDVTDSRFTDCGAIEGTMFVEANGTFRHNYNEHKRTRGPGVFKAFVNIDKHLGTGVREVIGSSFDAPMYVPAGALYPAQYRIEGNYFHRGIGQIANFGGTWRTFKGNLIRTEGGQDHTMQGDMLDNIWWMDAPSILNPHGPMASVHSGTLNQGNLIFHAGEIRISISAFFILNGFTVPKNQVYRIIGNLFLPNNRRQQSWWITAIISNNDGTGFNGSSIVVDNNTAFINDSPGGGYAIVSRHGSTSFPSPTGQLASFRSNLFWNPDPSKPSYKMYAYTQNLGGGNNVNVCLPENCDYNGSWNVKTDGNGHAGGANGYGDYFTGGVPGAHDFYADPNFVDQYRNPAQFDREFLGEASYATWSPGATYKADDRVSNADPTIQAGAVLNYNYVNDTFNGTSCGGKNPKPGDYNDLSRACWEWASLRSIRELLIGKKTFNNETIGASGDNVIATARKWVFEGATPRNKRFSNAGHKIGPDGVTRNDVGAVAVRPSPSVQGQ